jgi:general L-amino acid transport system permease protein
MTPSIAHPQAYVRLESVPAEAAPEGRRRTLWTVFFGDLASVIITLVAGGAILLLAPKIATWAFVNGVWTGDGEACRAADGACWAFLREKARFILFGIYPPDQHWRPAAAIGIVVAMALWSLPPRNWTKATIVAWLGAIAAMLALLKGGVFDLSEVPSSAWGGLPVTILLTIVSLGFGFPLAVVLALGRQSQARAVHMLCIGIIETVRGLPLLSLLFVASIVLPLMLPDGLSIDKLARALVALTIFSAAYLAEVLRGGLQSLPAGQREAAQSLGLSWLQATRLIILPQAIRKVIPPLTNTVIVMVKNTSLVLVVGLFDLLSSGRAAATDPAWPAAYKETYLFVGMSYFLICFGISRYSLWLEHRNQIVHS